MYTHFKAYYWPVEEELKRQCLYPPKYHFLPLKADGPSLFTARAHCLNSSQSLRKKPLKTLKSSLSGQNNSNKNLNVQIVFLIHMTIGRKLPFSLRNIFCLRKWCLRRRVCSDTSGCCLAHSSGKLTYKGGGLSFQNLCASQVIPQDHVYTFEPWDIWPFLVLYIPDYRRDAIQSKGTHRKTNTK